MVVDGDGSGRGLTHRRLEEHQRDKGNSMEAWDFTGEGCRWLATKAIWRRSLSPELREVSSRLLLGVSRANPGLDERGDGFWSKGC